MEAFLFSGATPADVTRQHAALTGVTPLPPLFALGYHQCRCTTLGLGLGSGRGLELG